MFAIFEGARDYIFTLTALPQAVFPTSWLSKSGVSKILFLTCDQGAWLAILGQKAKKWVLGVLVKVSASTPIEPLYRVL